MQVNVQTYGAVGDGVNNDLEAFVSAVEAVFASGEGGIVEVPPGN